jgi:hypothetical protein
MFHIGGKEDGFTIIELMVVLGSTGLLLLIALAFIGGQAAKNSFNASINNTIVKLQTEINKVSSGNESLPSNINCSPGVNIPPSIGNAGTTTTGSMSGCIFLGKSFYKINATDKLNKSLNVFDVAGNSNSGSDLSSNLATSFPTNITAANSYTNLLIPRGLWIKGITSGTNFLNSYSVGTVTQNIYTVTGTGTNFDYTMFGGNIVINNTNSEYIVSVQSSTKLTVSCDNNQTTTQPYGCDSSLAIPTASPYSINYGVGSYCGFAILASNSLSNTGSQYGLYALGYNGCQYNIPSSNPKQYTDTNMIDDNLISSINICLSDGTNSQILTISSGFIIKTSVLTQGNSLTVSKGNASC